MIESRDNRRRVKTSARAGTNIPNTRPYPKSFQCYRVILLTREMLSRFSRRRSSNSLVSRACFWRYIRFWSNVASFSQCRHTNTKRWGATGSDNGGPVWRDIRKRRELHDGVGKGNVFLTACQRWTTLAIKCIRTLMTPYTPILYCWGGLSVGGTAPRGCHRPSLPPVALEAATRAKPVLVSDGVYVRGGKDWSVSRRRASPPVVLGL